MRRFPAYLLAALCGLLMFVFGLMTIVAVDFQSPSQLMPTVMAMLTQMPPAAVATQLSQMGYSAPPSALATAQTMYGQGYPADVILSTLVAAYGSPNTGGNNTGGAVSPTQAPPVVQPIVASPTPVSPVNVVVPPPSQGQPQATAAGVVPLPTVSSVVVGEQPGNNLPAPTSAPPPVEVGTISGSVTYAGSNDGSGIMLNLTRPDGSSLQVPVSADGTFSFSGMQPGVYTLEANAVRYISVRAQFTLEAGQNFTLSPALLVAGDTNSDNVIDLLDASLVASNFGGPANVPAADLNHDGEIDVRDLTMIGNQFGLAGPVDWK